MLDNPRQEFRKPIKKCKGARSYSIIAEKKKDGVLFIAAESDPTLFLVKISKSA